MRMDNDAVGAAGRQPNGAVSDPWMRAMRRGDFAEAWRISDDVLRSRRGAPNWQLPRHEQSIWDGRPLDGKRILVRCYHGLGDTVQFVRYAALLRRIASEVTLWAQPALIPLLRTAVGVDRLLPLHDGTPEVAFDADIELMELAHSFRTTLATIPNEVPYLHPPRAPRAGTSGLAVGVAWQAGDWDERRSVDPALMARLADVPGVTLHVLQQGAARAEWPTGVGVMSGSVDVISFATLLTSLDLVISVDSFPAHLAGALAVPTWTLLHTDPDWRWMEGREDSPWYPTMRLWRQARPGDWLSVLNHVAEELAVLARAHSKRVTH